MKTVFLILAVFSLAMISCSQVEFHNETKPVESTQTNSNNEVITTKNNDAESNMQVIDGFVSARNKIAPVLKYDSLSKVVENLNTSEIKALLEADVFYSPYAPQEKENTIRDVFRNYGITETARQDYLLLLLHVIHVEGYHMKPWSIKDYSPDEINLLLNKSVGDGIAVWVSGELWTKLYSLSSSLIGEETSQKQAILNLVRWETRNFFHYYEDTTHNENYSKDIYGNFNSFDALFKERAVGCHDAAGILIAMLKSINIPAKELHLGNQWYEEGSKQGHGVVFIPSLNLYVHGDDIADLVIVPDSILMNETDMKRYHNENELGYIQSISKKYSSVRLYREGDSLYIRIGEFNEFFIPHDELDSTLEFLEKELPEFNPVLTYYESTDYRGGKMWVIKSTDSQRVKIKGLAEY